MKLVDNEFLRSQILKRLEELDWTDAELLKDIEERGYPIAQSRWSKYKSNSKGQITDDQLLFIATRLGIYVHINFGTPVLEEGKIKFEIKRFNEIEALLRLKKIFPNIK